MDAFFVLFEGHIWGFSKGLVMGRSYYKVPCGRKKPSVEKTSSTGGGSAESVITETGRSGCVVRKAQPPDTFLTSTIGHSHTLNSCMMRVVGAPPNNEE